MTPILLAAQKPIQSLGFPLETSTRLSRVLAGAFFHAVDEHCWPLSDEKILAIPGEPHSRCAFHFDLGKKNISDCVVE